MYGISNEWTAKSAHQSSWDYLTTCYGTHLYERVLKDDGRRLDTEWCTSVPDIPSLVQYGVPVIVSPAEGHDVQGTVNLYDFVHPENAIYVFGPDYRNLTWEEIALTPSPPVVYIEVPPGSQSKEMFSHTAAGIVLYDRALKSRMII